MADEEEGKEYRWETGYEKTWEAIKEDDDGLVEASVAEIIHNAKRKRQLDRKAGARLGMMRHLYIILDTSEAMSNQDLKPTRLLCSLKLLEDFVDEFFYQNPISQVGLIITKNKRAEKISDLAGNSKKHIKEIKALQQTTLAGEPSLQNSLEVAIKSLRLLPSHASKEIIIITGSLTTCDPGDITETIQLNAHIDPPPAATRLDAALVKMGFPHHALQSSGTDTSIAVCMCHAENSDGSVKLTSTGFLCPQCLSKHCELPVECRACGLTLVSAPHLARSYHYLFPVAPFKELDYEDEYTMCYGCQKILSQKDKKIYICEKCSRIFCIDCEIFIHESLHTCPGCATNQTTYQKFTEK
ncbi:hypothetical protein M0802_001995 [Mischocyttarus mexicanus]|nr:hypothetical protein M0802_001995 [Mischocyttarus mexicanus]